jgi:hypothetical protein
MHAMLVSDELPHYGTVLDELFHEQVTIALMGKSGRPKTPAMAANVVDHQWTFSEPLAYPALYQ